MKRVASTRSSRENDCPTCCRSGIVPKMSIESPSLRETAVARGERENDRQKAIANGHCEHWDHSRGSAGPIVKRNCHIKIILTDNNSAE